MLKVLMLFHHWSAQWITGITAKRRAGGEWGYPAVMKEMYDAGLHPIEVYINIWKATIADRLALRPVCALCTEAERMPGTIRMIRWWDQDAVNEPE